ncbi:MAG: hypothetical protein HY393_01090 [Candidatus Diapherotrites archaeon]|nr:hypothetical protein [Candidatus Diapherotrites archaeon]
MQMYYTKDDLERKANKSLSILENRKKIENYLVNTKKNNEQVVSHIETTLKALPCLKNDLLAKHYEEVMHSLQFLLCTYDLSRPEFFDPVNKKVRNALLLKGVKDEELNEVAVMLTTSTESSVLDQGEREWLSLVLHAKKNGANSREIAEKLRVHQEKYGWIGTAENDKPWDMTYYKEQLQNDLCMSEGKIVKRMNTKQENKNNLQAKQILLQKKLQLKPETVYLLDLTKEFAHIRFDTRLAWVKSGFMLKKIFNEIKIRTGVKEEQLQRYRLKEMLELLKNNKKLNKKIIDKRKSSYVFHLKNNKIKFYVGKDAEGFANQINKMDYSNLTEIRGQVANPGIVRGKVRLIYAQTKNQEAEMSNMKEGEILVTGMTRPHLIAAMKKAAAIVTDEGGVTSHAAIVSRELNKPCVIGTKIATKWLKNGNMVEVDANKGIIRILKGI